MDERINKRSMYATKAEVKGKPENLRWTLTTCSIGINRVWLFWLVGFFRVLLGKTHFWLVWLIGFFVFYWGKTVFGWFG